MKCKQCGITNPDFFYKSIASYCRNHWKAKVRRNRKKNVEHYREYDSARNMRPDRIEMRAKYQKTPQGKKNLSAAKSRWDKRNVLKKAAHIMVNNAVRDGRLIKIPCEICGSTKRIHGHHEDYSKPFDVKWLCPKHHTEAHKEKL